MKRVLVLSDPHCGHNVGLTHPDFDAMPPRSATTRLKLYRHRRKCWEWYANQCAALQPIDIVIHNGDAIEGKGPRSGSTELIATDRNEQCEMAAAVIEEPKAKSIVMSYGTPAHAGKLEDWEDIVARDVGALKIGSHDAIDVNGLIIDYRHHVGSSSVPYGRHTQVAKERLWNQLWAVRGEYPVADVIIRSHVHYHAYAGGADWLAMTTPALQGYGSKYGARICSGTVDFGLVWLDVVSKTEWTWSVAIKRFTRLKAKAMKL